MSAKIIGFVNYKGGVGKTSLAAQTYMLLARKNKKCLIVDADGQRSTTSTLCPELPDDALTMYDIYEGNCSGREAVRKTEFGDIIPGDQALNDNQASAYISRLQFKAFTVLKKAVDELKDSYDYILIDSPPNNGLFTTNVIIACDGIVVPIIPDRFSVDGLVNIKDSLAEAGEFYGREIPIYGIVLNMVDLRYRTDKETVVNLPAAAKQAQIPYFKTYIRKSAGIKDAISARESIQSYAPGSNGAKDINDFVDELVKVVKKQKA